MIFEIGDAFSFEVPERNRQRNWMMIVNKSGDDIFVKFFDVKRGRVRPDSGEAWDIIYSEKDLLEMKEKKGIRRVDPARVAKVMLGGCVEEF